MQFKNLFLALPALVAAQGGSLQSVLAGNSDLSSLVSLLQTQPNLLGALGSATNVTLLAPSNAALSALLNSTTGASLANNTAAVAALLQYHVLNGTYFASQIPTTAAFVPTLLTDPRYTNVSGGQRVEVVSRNGTVSIYSGLLQNSTVTSANLNFTGGTVHVINKVLTLPGNVTSTLQNAGLSAAWGALNATQLSGPVDSLSGVTIFAPNNSAFAAISNILANASVETLTSVLRYHVHNGSRVLYSSALSNTSISTLQGTNITVRAINGSVYVNDARVIVPDLLVAGGVVHVIDQVLNPSNTTANATGPGQPAFSGASSGTSTPFTSNVPGPAQSTGAGAGRVTSSSTTGGAGPINTAAAGMGAAAIIGAFGALLI